jgi:hypothetical protein
MYIRIDKKKVCAHLKKHPLDAVACCRRGNHGYADPFMIGRKPMLRCSGSPSRRVVKSSSSLSFMLVPPPSIFQPTSLQPLGSPRFLGRPSPRLLPRRSTTQRDPELRLHSRFTSICRIHLSHTRRRY